MRLRLFIVLVFGVNLSAWAQDLCVHQIQGQVLDLDTRQPIPYVTVIVEEEPGKGAITDVQGVFEIKGLCEKEFTLVVSHVGYKEASHHHDSYHDHPTILLASDDHLLESVVVEGIYNQTSLQTISIDRLSSEDFTAAQSESLGELAGRITGISTISTGQNVVKPIIHGLHSNRVLIVNNGVRHEFQNWGIEHAPEIDPSLAGSVEVVKGAATVRYGPDALGGVILVNPPKLELGAGFEGTAGVVAKSNGRSGEGDLQLSYGSDNLVVAVSGAMVGQGDLQTPDYVLTNTGKQEYSYASSLRYHKHSFDLEGYYSHFYQSLGILRGSVNGSLEDLANAMESEVPPGTSPFSYDLNNPRQQVTHDLMKLKGGYVWDNQDISFQYAYQLNHRQEYDVRKGTNNEIPSVDLKLATQTFEVDWNHPDLGHVNGNMGLQWFYQDNNNVPGTNTVPFVPNYNVMRAGLFAVERLEAGSTTYELGLRYDFQYNSVRGRAPSNEIYSNELTYSQLTGSAGLKQNLKNHLNFRSNVGLAWRPPNVSELYIFGKHQASIEYGLWRYAYYEEGKISVSEVLSEEKKPVKPEIGIKWINTLEGEQDGNHWELTAYTNVIRNYIYTRPAGITNTVRGAFPYFIYDQGDALFWGLDAAYRLELTQFWKLEAKSSYVWAINLKERETFTNIPPARVDVGLDYERKPDFLSSSRVALGLSYVFRYFQEPRVITVREILEAEAEGQDLFAENNEMFDFMAAPDGYFLANLSWSAAVGKWEWSARISNLLNKRYRVYTDRLRYFADQTGRNVQLSLRYRI